MVWSSELSSCLHSSSPSIPLWMPVFHSTYYPKMKLLFLCNFWEDFLVMHTMVFFPFFGNQSWQAGKNSGIATDNCAARRQTTIWRKVGRGGPKEIILVSGSVWYLQARRDLAEPLLILPHSVVVSAFFCFVSVPWLLRDINYNININNYINKLY